MRGEQGNGQRWAQPRPGSPPLARGTGSNFSRGWQGRRDHPRLRGEQLSSAFSFLVIVGSPPLARGTGPNGNDGRICRRITPACAGNRMGRFECGANSRDHPRLRGEQCIVYRPYFFNLGSPPLARGTDNVAKCPPPARGITPACAGNRPLIRLNSCLKRDHPRLRGEQLSWYCQCV